MEKYMPEQICPYCNHFYDCQCRSKAGSCHDWILDSGYEHLIGLIEIDDLVLYMTFRTNLIACFWFGPDLL